MANPLISVYANSLLAALNSRRSLQGKGQDNNTTDTALSIRLTGINHERPRSIIQVSNVELDTGWNISAQKVFPCRCIPETVEVVTRGGDGLAR